MMAKKVTTFIPYRTCLCPTIYLHAGMSTVSYVQSYSGHQQKQTWRRKIQNDRRLGTVGIFTYYEKTWAGS